MLIMHRIQLHYYESSTGFLYESVLDSRHAASSKKYFYGNAPDYLRELLHVYTPSRAPATAATLLEEPQSSIVTYGERAFAVARPQIWNELPGSICQIETLLSFRELLKKYIFSRAFLHC